MPDQPQGCARVTGTVAGEKPVDRAPDQPVPGKESAMAVRVGQKAPDFTAPAYHKGVLLCFYPGDFTFV
jgi:hypothetical protein